MDTIFIPLPLKIYGTWALVLILILLYGMHEVENSENIKIFNKLLNIWIIFGSLYALHIIWR